MKENKKQKNGHLHITLLLIVTLLMIAIFPIILSDWRLSEGYSHKNIIRIFLFFNTIFLGYFWLNGFKDVVYVLFYLINRKRFKRIEKECFDKSQELIDSFSPKVLLLYCTCNDFMSECLLKSMGQNYTNFDTVILDDSSQIDYLVKIDNFASHHDVQVVRRKDGVGYKAGNINNYLKHKTDYDYFIILDSDEIIPVNFILDSLKIFNSYKDVGIVQARHIGTRNENFFMQLFSRSIKANWPTYLQTKQYYGFQFFFGHGALISKECYQQAGGFPNLVAEDLCFSLKARVKGYYTIYANSIECEEQFPVDYYAFKKRHSKWTQGNLEFLKKYANFIFNSSLNWYEKFDLVLFTFNLPLMAVFTMYLLMNIIAFPILNFFPQYDLWVLVPTLLVFLAPTLNDIIYFARLKSFFHFLMYWFSSLLMYGSLFFLSLTTYIKSLCGVKAKFLVTPKSSKDIKFLDAFWLSKGELFYGTILTILALHFTKNIFSVVLIIIPALSSPFLFLVHKINNKKLLIVQNITIQRKSLKAEIESIQFLQSKLFDETNELIVIQNGKIISHFMITGRRMEKNGKAYLLVEETNKKYSKIRYPLATTNISYSDISEYY